MNEEKYVTLEMFEKYHERLMGFIKNGDGFVLDIEEDDEEQESPETLVQKQE